MLSIEHKVETHRSHAELAPDGQASRGPRGAGMTIDVVTDRVNRGLSQQQLADAIGVSVDVIRNVEKTGRRSRPANALRVATHYGLTVTELWPSSTKAAD